MGALRCGSVLLLSATFAVAGCGAEASGPDDSAATEDDTEALSASLLVNGGFESPLGSTSWPERFHATRTTAAAHTGEYGVRISPLENPFQVTDLGSRQYRVTPGLRYIATAYARRATAGAGFAHIGLSFQDDQAGNATTRGDESSLVSGSGAWEFKRVSMVAPAGVEHVTVWADVEGGTASWDFDNFALRTCQENSTYCSTNASCCSGHCVTTGEHMQCEP